MMIAYHLEIVPQPPQVQDWRDHLRWMVAVMDRHDPDLPFIASLFSYCLREGHITPKQSMCARTINDRIRAMFDHGKLELQRQLEAIK